MPYPSMVLIRSSQNHGMWFYTTHHHWFQIAENTDFPVLPIHSRYHKSVITSKAFLQGNICKTKSCLERPTCISSRGMYLTRPLTTVLGASSPTSISSTYSESASGCFSAFLISPLESPTLQQIILPLRPLILSYQTFSFVPFLSLLHNKNEKI